MFKTLPYFFIAALVLLCSFSKVAPAPSSLFETQLNTLLEAYPNDFENLKGAKSYSAKDTMSYEWKCTTQLEGASETYIAKNYPTDTHLSLIARFENFEKKEDAEAKYKLLVEKIKACKINCCEMTVSEGKDATKVFTDWTVKAANPKTKSYDNMVLRVKLADHNYGNSFRFYSLGLVIFKK
jgi:hypothetical protein